MKIVDAVRRNMMIPARMKRALFTLLYLLVSCQSFLFGQNEAFAASEKQQAVEERLKKRFLNRRLPPFQFVSLNGKVISSKSVEGKTLVVNFWFTTCSPCVSEIPLLNELIKKFQGNTQIVFIAPALDQRTALNRFLKKNPFLYEIIPDSKDYVALLDIDSYPSHVILGPDGIVRDIFVGTKENIGALLENSINRISNSK